MKGNKPRIYWDACAWVGWSTDRFHDQVLCTQLLEQAERGNLEIVVGTLALAEFAPRDKAVDDQLLRYLSHDSFLVVSLTRFIAMQARELVRRYPGLRGPDAAHLATALYAKADFLHTHDGYLLSLANRVEGIVISKPQGPAQTTLVFDVAATREGHNGGTSKVD
jgi:predicted nucleic acid-binding protein